VAQLGGKTLAKKYQEPYSQHFLFYATYEQANQLVFFYNRLEKLARNKHSSLLWHNLVKKHWLKISGTVFTALPFLRNLKIGQPASILL
jgi:hypothetical protein